MENTTFNLYKNHQVKCNSLDDFLDTYRRHDRYKGRDGKEWGFDYSNLIKKSHEQDLIKYGITWISPYESNTGNIISYIQNPL